MQNPFDDPAFAKTMASMGVVHKPGLAAEFLREAEPLLTAEGIDVNNLDAADPDVVNAALARATERHNLELFTPVDERRTQAVAVLRDFVEALDADDIERAEAVLAAVPSDPTKHHPSVAHVVGAGLGLLDTWWTTGASPRRLTMPDWREPVQNATRDIAELAAAGRAFDNLGHLIVNHGGKQVLEGTALAVVVYIDAVAKMRGVPVHDIAKELLHEGGDASRKTKKHAKKHASAADHILLRDFEAWLRNRPETQAEADDEVAVLSSLLTLARHLTINHLVPSGVEALVDEIADASGSESMAEMALVTLYDYVDFRDDGQEGWDKARDVIQAALQPLQAFWAMLGDAINAADSIEPGQRRRAYAKANIVAMVPHLLEWIGSGRQVAPSGGLRRADIAEAAAMLGVSAVGVNRLPSDTEVPDLFADDDVEPGTIYAMSMRDVTVLASWWDALQVADVIEITGSRVRRGPNSARWLDEALPPLDLAEIVIGMFLVRLITDGLSYRDPFESRVIELTLARLTRAVVHWDEDEQLSPFDESLQLRVLRKLKEMQRVGLLTLDEKKDVLVEPELRGVFARTIMTTRAAIDELD